MSTYSTRSPYYTTTTLCPTCGKLLPGEVRALDGGVFLVRTCPDHGPFEALVCSDIEWYEGLSRFDVKPTRPVVARTATDKGCPADCGLCPAHRQIAGTTAIEISNRCNSSCPVCLADNLGTFEMSVEEVSSIIDEALRAQKTLDVVTLSGGEPTIHPRLLDIIQAVDRPEVGRIVVNSNGIRIAEDDRLLDQLAGHPKVYVCLHHDGPSAARIRGVDFSVQERALDRLCRWKVSTVPLILAVKGVNEGDLGGLVASLLTRSPVIKTVMVSLMAYAGRRGSHFEGDPRARLTTPAALSCLESGSAGRLHKRDFMPVPMPNPVCAAIGYFLIDGDQILPLVSAAGVDRVVEYLQNSHFAKPDETFERFFRELVDTVYANSASLPDAAKLLGGCKAFLARLFPEGRSVPFEERKAVAEESIKSVFFMQFMDAWTFDSVRLSKCSCQHLLPDGIRIPSCGYYTYHRQFDARFAPAGTP
jgi:hypothetical protein